MKYTYSHTKDDKVSLCRADADPRVYKGKKMFSDEKPKHLKSIGLFIDDYDDRCSIFFM